MTPLEIVLFVVAMLALIGVSVAFGTCAAKWRRTSRRLEDEIYLRGKDLGAVEADARAERKLRVAAQRKAADGFVRLKELEAELAALGAATQYVGIAYETGHAGVASVMRSLQKVMGHVQRSQCDAAHAIFREQKGQVLAALGDNPIRCTKVAAVLEASSADIEAALREQLPANMDAAAIVREIKAIWTLVVVHVCDASGVVDVGMLDAFMTAVFASVCGAPRLGA